MSTINGKRAAISEKVHSDGKYDCEVVYICGEVQSSIDGDIIIPVMLDDGTIGTISLSDYNVVILSGKELEDSLPKIAVIPPSDPFPLKRVDGYHPYRYIGMDGKCYYSFGTVNDAISSIYTADQIVQCFGATPGIPSPLTDGHFPCRVLSTSLEEKESIMGSATPGFPPLIYKDGVVDWDRNTISVVSVFPLVKNDNESFQGSDDKTYYALERGKYIVTEAQFEEQQRGLSIDKCIHSGNFPLTRVSERGGLSDYAPADDSETRLVFNGRILDWDLSD